MFFYSKRKAQMFLVTFQNPQKSRRRPTKIPPARKGKDKTSKKTSFSVFQEMVATNNCSTLQKNPFLFSNQMRT